MGWAGGKEQQRNSPSSDSPWLPWKTLFGPPEICWQESACRSPPWLQSKCPQQRSKQPSLRSADLGRSHKRNRLCTHSEVGAWATHKGQGSGGLIPQVWKMGRSKRRRASSEHHQRVPRALMGEWDEFPPLKDMLMDSKYQLWCFSFLSIILY